MKQNQNNNSNEWCYFILKSVISHFSLQLALLPHFISSLNSVDFKSIYFRLFKLTDQLISLSFLLYFFFRRGWTTTSILTTNRRLCKKRTNDLQHSFLHIFLFLAKNVLFCWNLIFYFMFAYVYVNFLWPKFESHHINWPPSYKIKKGHCQEADDRISLFQFTCFFPSCLLFTRVCR